VAALPPGSSHRACPEAPLSVEEQFPKSSADERGRALLEISNAMVGLYKEQFGRGPTRARTYWAGPDIVVSVLEDTLTPAERNMVALGEHERLRDLRVFLQYATLAEFCAPVERITGRRVKAFHSSIDTVMDGMAIEAFVLYREGEEGPSRTERPGL